MLDTDLWQPSRRKIVPQWLLEWLVQRSGTQFQETDLWKRCIYMSEGYNLDSVVTRIQYNACLHYHKHSSGIFFFLLFLLLALVMYLLVLRVSLFSGQSRKTTSLATHPTCENYHNLAFFSLSS